MKTTVKRILKIMDPLNITTQVTNQSNSQIKAIIFDFDGVLSSFVVRLGWPLMQSVYMVKPDITEKQVTESSLEVFSMLTTLDKKPKNTSLAKFSFQMGKKMGMTNFQALKFIVTTVIMYAKSRMNIVPTVGVRSVLRELLAQDYKVILLTNTSRKVIKKATKKIPEINDFDLILTRDDIDNIKPDASGFFKVLKIMNLKASEVLAIGDQASDIIAGKRAGIKTVAVVEKQMAHSRPHLQEQNPDFFLRDMRDLPSLLKFLRDCIIEDIRTTIDLNEMSLSEYITQHNLSST